MARVELHLRAQAPAAEVLQNLSWRLATARADHTWEAFHWPHPLPMASVTVVDSTTSSWEAAFAAATADWSASPVIDLAATAGAADIAARNACSAVAGSVRVCNARYGRNDWLRLTEIWTDGDHILQARVRLNDTYLTARRYSRKRWLGHELGHALGHALGLDHQDGRSCMTASSAVLSDPAYARPNGHDYAPLEAVYPPLHASDAAADRVSTLAAGRALNR